MKEPNMFHNYETRKSLLKPAMRQKTCNKCGRNNRTTRYNCSFSDVSLALQVIFSGGTIKQHLIIIITCCSVVPPEIVTHDAYISGRSENYIWRADCS